MLRQRLLALVGLLALMAVVFGTYQAVSSWHPTAVPSAPVTGKLSLVQLTNPKAVVDPGVSLDRPAPHFTLLNQQGKPLSLSQYRGKVVVLAFANPVGTTESALTGLVLRNVLHDLGRYASDAAILLINANPLDTSPTAAAHWVRDHHFPGQFLTGTASRLKAIWRAYAVESEVLPQHLIQYIPAVFVIDRTGRERWVYINAAAQSASVLGREVEHVLQHVVPLLPGHPPRRDFPNGRELNYLPGTLGPSLSAHPFRAEALLPGGGTGTIQVGMGHGAVLLDFFATWCPDCQEEVTALKQYGADAKAQHLPPVVAVDLRLSEPSTAAVRAYADRVGLSYPIALDSTGTISNAYGVTGLPTEVLVSSTGRILWYHAGLIDRGALLIAIRQHLAR